MDVIGELLRDGLLTSLGTDGDRAGFLREAVDRLAACLGGDDLLLFPAAVMLAAGEDVDLKDAVTGVTRDCILESWETFTNAFTDEPTEIFRAVATGAVANAADTAGTRLALAGWYQIRTAMEMLEPGRTWPQLDALRGRWCEISEAEALRRWQPAAVSAQLRMPSVATVEDGTFDIATDVAATAARVFTDSGGAAQNFSAHLMPVFADMVQGLISYSDEVALEAHRRSVDVVKELAGALGGKLREVVAAQEQTLSAATLRNDLLWWRTSGWSMSASAAYKDLGSPAVIAVRAALDLHRLVPDAVPVVVEHVLATAVDEIVVATQAEGEDPEVTLDVEALVEAAKVTDVGAAPSMPPLCPGTLLHAAVGGHNWRGADAGLAPGRAAVLLFRDLQTARLLASA